MSRYNMYFTKQDALEQQGKIEQISNENGLDIDMWKVKRQSGDSVYTLLKILERKYGKDKNNEQT